MPCVASLRQRIAGTEGVRALRYVAESERLLAPTQPTR
jgi:hypothetical protein